MKIEISTALISFFSAVIVVVVSELLKHKKEEKDKIDQINSKYLNPLRLYLEETYIRLSEILEKTNINNKNTALTFINNSDEIQDKKSTWFLNEGVYLISSCYFTGCLFSMIKLVREDLPYIKLKKKRNDTMLLNLIFKINHAFLQDHGIYYGIQHSIGDEMFVRQERRLITYREFCSKIIVTEERIWFDRLINFYVETGKNQKIHRIEMAISAIKELSMFLDENIAGGYSIKERLIFENKFMNN
ncbi:MAG: hypothetical protein ACKV1O_17930 [Saprospiraceae bacterium]